MQAIKEKVSNVVSSAKQQSEVRKANAEEKKDNARCEMEKGVAKEMRMAREAETEMHLHEARAEHKAERVDATFRSKSNVEHEAEGANETYLPSLGTHNSENAQSLADGDQLLPMDSHHGHQYADSVAPADITTMGPKSV